MNSDFKEVKVEGFAFSPLEGEHTVPRAEWSALIFLACHVLVNVIVVADPLYLYELWCSGKDKCLASEDSDLWKRLFGAIDAREGLVALHWCPIISNRNLH